MSTAIDMIDEDMVRKNPEANQKDVGVFKTSAKSGNVGVVDLGDRAKTYTIDLDEIDALTVLDNKHNSDLQDIMKLGQDEKRFQNKQLGLIDNETGELDPELIELVRVAASGESDMIQLKDAGDGFVEVYAAGDWSTDIFRFEGDQINDLLAELSDMDAICELLDKGVDLKDRKSDIGVFVYDDVKDQTFSGDDGLVASQTVKQEILGGSKIDLGEAVDLVQYGLSSEGLADEDISVDITGDTVVVELNINNRGAVDTLIFKGDAFFDALSTSTHNGNSIVDLKNSNSQLGVFDFDDLNANGKAPKYFHGNDADVDSAAVRSILGGSSLDEAEAVALVEYAMSEAGQADDGIRYLGGDDDSAIIAIEASRDTVDTLLISGDNIDFV